jgi:myosin heavy subunit
MFVHALTLQQITYMGVLESVDLKQKNFPYRKKYEEFYARYELLGPLYGTCRYEKMQDKKMYDFRELSVKIVNDTLQ